MAKRVVQTLPQMFIDVAEEEESRKIPVAAYARVSTEREEQEDSFERQVEHYTQMINARPEWKLVKIYADPGISGTRAEKRPEFMQMIEDCRAGKIQKVLVKSISRFARNTVDSLTYIRELKDLGISVYFESENIDTLTPGGEVLIAILSAMAVQESRTISSNIKWAWQRKWQNGEVHLNTGLMLGYRKTDKKDEDGHTIYEINEEEAEIVRRIYREYLAGISITRICRNLEADGIKTKLGKERWYARTVLNILSNELYIGNATMGKTFKPDVLSKKRVKNDGKTSPIYHVKESHPAIIDEESFEAVKKEMSFRADGGTAATSQNKYTSKYPFSGMLICGHCGTRLRRQIRTVGSGKRIPSWGCSRRIVEGRSICDSHHVNEEMLENTYKEAMRQLVDGMDEILETVGDGLSETTGQAIKDKIEAIENEIAEIQEKVIQAQRQKTAKALDLPTYNALIKESAEKIQELENKKAELQDENTNYYASRAWINSFEEAVANGSVQDARNGFIIKQMVESITIYDEYMQIRFKCGVTFDQPYVK